MPSLRKFLFENEAVVGINSPCDYLYIKVLRFTFITITSWPHKELGEYENEKLTMTLLSLYLVSVIACFTGSIAYIFIHNHELTFLEVGHMHLITLMKAVDISRIITLSFSAKYREVAKDFLTKIHLFFYKHRSEYAMKTHKQVHLVSHLFTMYLVGQMISGLSLFNLIPMYSNYAAGKFKPGGLENSTFEHAAYFPYPFNTSTNINGYIIVCIIHWLMSYQCSTWFCMFDLLLFLMVFNLWGHFKILINNLNNFPKPSAKSSFVLNGINMISEKYSENELLEVSEKLKECIEYHREIVTFKDRMSKVFGPMLFVYYTFLQASGCILLLECSQMTTQALMRYLPLTLILFQQLIQVSIIFELLGSESAKLKDAVYGIPWECMDTRNRKVVAFFLMNVQEPVHVKAMGVADVGVTSMATILKTSLSYFTFLRSV